MCYHILSQWRYCLRLSRYFTVNNVLCYLSNFVQWSVKMNDWLKANRRRRAKKTNKKTTCWIVNPFFYPLIDGHTVYVPQFIGIKVLQDRIHCGSVQLLRVIFYHSEKYDLYSVLRMMETVVSCCLTIDVDRFFCIGQITVLIRFNSRLRDGNKEKIIPETSSPLRIKSKNFVIIVPFYILFFPIILIITFQHVRCRQSLYNVGSCNFIV